MAGSRQTAFNLTVFAGGWVLKYRVYLSGPMRSRGVRMVFTIIHTNFPLMSFISRPTPPGTGGGTTVWRTGQGGGRDRRRISSSTPKWTLMVKNCIMFPGVHPDVGPCFFWTSGITPRFEPAIVRVITMGASSLKFSGDGCLVRFGSSGCSRTSLADDLDPLSPLDAPLLWTILYCLW